MNRNEWVSLYRQLRLGSRNKRQSWDMANVMHGGTYWTIKHVRRMNNDTAQGLIVYPSIIRDRAPSARINDWLLAVTDFRRDYRKAYSARHKAMALDAMRACIADAREVRLSASIFHAIG